MGQLDNIIYKNHKPPPFFEYNNTTVTLQEGSRWSGWLNNQYKICTDSSINFLNVYDNTLYNEDNMCGTIDIPVIERTFDNDYTHVLYDI